MIGTSAGGLHALTSVLSVIPGNFPLPLIIVQHRSQDYRDLLEEVLQRKCQLEVKQADEKEPIRKGVIYIAPPGYHLMVERDKTFSLTIDEPVKYSRPSIDVLFETAAEVYKNKLVGIVLTGANDDGANGIRAIWQYGGFTIAQDPNEAEYSTMPLQTIQSGAVKIVLTLKEIQHFLIQLGQNGKNDA